MAIVAIAGVSYFQPEHDAVEVLMRLKRAIERAEPYHGGVLSAAESSLARWEAGDAALAELGVILDHERIAAELGMQHWEVHAHFRREPQVGLGKLELKSWILPVSPVGVGASWGLMMNLMPQVVPVLAPDLAMINGNQDVAWGSDLRPGELPAFFAPWTYIGPARLTDDRRRALAALPDCRSEALGPGWLVQATDDLYQRPSATFVRALAAIPSWKTIKYKQSRPPNTRTEP